MLMSSTALAAPFQEYVVEASLPGAKPEDISIFTRTLPITVVMRLPGNEPGREMRRNSKAWKGDKQHGG